MTFYEFEGPTTLQAVMRDSVGFGLRERYKPGQEVPHGFLVLLMQMKEESRAERLRASSFAPQDLARRCRFDPTKQN